MHSIQKSIPANTKSVYGTDVITTRTSMVSTNALCKVLKSLVSSRPIAVRLSYSCRVPREALPLVGGGKQWDLEKNTPLLLPE